MSIFSSLLPPILGLERCVTISSSGMSCSDNFDFRVFRMIVDEFEIRLVVVESVIAAILKVRNGGL